jgi:hypothetical protein
VNALFVAASAFFFPDIFGWVFPSAGVSFFIEYIYTQRTCHSRRRFLDFLSIFSESLNCSFFEFFLGWALYGRENGEQSRAARNVLRQYWGMKD